MSLQDFYHSRPWEKFLASLKSQGCRAMDLYIVHSAGSRLGERTTVLDTIRFH